MMAAMFAPLVNDSFLRACRRQATPHTPVWLMRQAGRYLPEYNATRAKAGSFLKLAKSPALATEVALQPLERYPLDAAWCRLDRGAPAPLGFVAIEHLEKLTLLHGAPSTGESS